MTPQLASMASLVPTHRRAVTDLRIVGVPRTHPCRRGATRCTGRAPGPRTWCSDLCRRVDVGISRIPGLAGAHQMTVGPDVAVIHALPWLDTRAVVAA